MGESLSAEQERAAIVAYTGLWQLRELDPAAESPGLRAARLDLRDRLDANAADADDARRRTLPTKRPSRAESPRPIDRILRRQ